MTDDTPYRAALSEFQKFSAHRTGRHGINNALQRYLQSRHNAANGFIDAAAAIGEAVGVDVPRTVGIVVIRGTEPPPTVTVVVGVISIRISVVSLGIIGSLFTPLRIISTM